MTETALNRIKNRGLNDYGEVPLQYADYLALLAVVEAAQELADKQPEIVDGSWLPLLDALAAVRSPATGARR